MVSDYPQLRGISDQRDHGKETGDSGDVDLKETFESVSVRENYKGESIGKGGHEEGVTENN